MTTDEIKKYHEELKLSDALRLEFMEAHARRLEDERSHLKELVERLTAYSPPRAKDTAMALGYLNVLANAPYQPHGGSENGRKGGRPQLTDCESKAADRMCAACNCWKATRANCS